MIRALVRLVLGLGLAAAVLWFALPVAASGIAGAAVAAAGLRAEGVTTAVVARPPLKLLLLEADAVVVRSGPGTWRGLTFASLEVTLRGVRVGSAPRDVTGRIEDVAFPDAGGATVRASSIELSGAASTPDLRVRLGLADVRALIGRALPAGLGGPETPITLVGTDGVRIATPAGDLTARITVRPDGGLDLIVSAPGTGAQALELLAPGEALPIRLASATVEGGSLVLSGTLDARSLGL